MATWWTAFPRIHMSSGGRWVGALRPGVESVETAAQPALISGFYRCDDCGRLCDRLRKTARFRLCDVCWERVVPVIPDGMKVTDGSPEQAAVMRWAEWREGIERRVPPRRSPGHAARLRPLGVGSLTADEFYPGCACGGRRRERPYGRRRGLFGGPFFDLCSVCEAKRSVEGHVGATSWLHPEWDDEEWLDLLWRVMPEAFELGVLPGYWFELRGR